jgi:hypothetical protein
MIDPTLALQTLIGDVLAADPAITAYVDPVNIRASSIRPGNMPAIMVSPARVQLLGHASGGQIVAEVRAMLHIWAVEDGSTVAQAVASAVMAALIDAPHAEGFAIDQWERPELVWARDPDPARSHTQGTVALRAVLRWRAD